MNSFGKYYLLGSVAVLSVVIAYVFVSNFVLNGDFIYNMHVNVLEDDVKSAEEVGDLEVEHVAEKETLIASKGGFVEEDNPFKDLALDHKEADAIIALYYRGILSGYSDRTFRPDRKINRAEFTKILVEAANVDFSLIGGAYLNNCFADVKDLESQWFTPFVCSAKYKNWIDGYDDGYFRPEQNINKAEGLKIVLSSFGFTVPEPHLISVMPYRDVADGVWYAGFAKAGKENRIVSDGILFNAGWQLTRADVAGMVYRAMRAKGLL